jgi:hypothetical protein
VSPLDAVERVARVAPFGVRFVDDHDGGVVADGLSVGAWPTGQPSRARQVRRNGGNVFFLMDIGGLRGQEFGAGDDGYWSGISRRVGFTFDVQDRQGRFLPFRFSAELPHRGLLRLACGSPLAPIPLPEGAASDGIPLFTAPARPSSSGTVVIRADLWDAANHVPAAWALLEARTPGARLRGEAPARALADHRGCVALHFPFPEERDFDGGSFDSPIGAGNAPLSARTWMVELEVFYGRLPPAPGTRKRRSPPIPDLCAALSQPPARLWDRLGAVPVEVDRVSLRFGQETLLQSTDVGLEPPSVLLLTPSQSPP